MLLLIRNLKKNLQEVLTQSPHDSLLFFDEARFGTHSKLGHGWFPCGVRTKAKVKLGFKNFYVYSAVNVNDGDDFSLFLPTVNTTMMNEFLKQLSDYLKGNRAILVVDCAGWHKSKSLKIPDNIKLVYLPPYSPELNPVEKLWQYVKSRTIKNKIYTTLEDLELAVSDLIQSLTPDLIKITCSPNHYLN